MKAHHLSRSTDSFAVDKLLYDQASDCLMFVPMLQMRHQRGTGQYATAEKCKAIDLSELLNFDLGQGWQDQRIM